MNATLKGPEDFPNNLKKEEAQPTKDDNVMEVQTNKEEIKEIEDDYDLVFEEDYGLRTWQYNRDFIALLIHNLNRQMISAVQ